MSVLNCGRWLQHSHGSSSGLIQGFFTYAICCIKNVQTNVASSQSSWQRSKWRRCSSFYSRQFLLLYKVHLCCTSRVQCLNSATIDFITLLHHATIHCILFVGFSQKPEWHWTLKESLLWPNIQSVSWHSFIRHYRRRWCWNLNHYLESS